MLYQTRQEMLATLGASVREARLAANLSLETTAARSGISLTALRNLEGGRNASTVTLLAVADRFGIGTAPQILEAVKSDV